MTREQLSGFLLVFAVAMALAVPIIGSFLVQDYSHIENYISELGAIGTKWGAVISFGGFLPVGIFVISFLIVRAPLVKAERSAKVGYYLLLCIGLSYLVAAFAPCDAGCPAGGTLRQNIHNSLGIIEYVLGGVGLLLFASGYNSRNLTTSYRLLLFAAGVVVLVSFFAMASPELAMWRGLSQRIAEVCLFGALIIVWRVSSPQKF